jgi:hypothetical protein
MFGHSGPDESEHGVTPFYESRSDPGLKVNLSPMYGQE